MTAPFIASRPNVYREYGGSIQPQKRPAFGLPCGVPFSVAQLGRCSCGACYTDHTPLGEMSASQNQQGKLLGSCGASALSLDSPIVSLLSPLVFPCPKPTA